MAGIERIHELFCPPVWAVVLLLVLPFSGICVVTVSIEIRCNV